MNRGRLVTRAIVSLGIVAGIVGAATQVETPPYRAFGGMIWVKKGIHYLSDNEISDRIEEMNSPYESRIAEHIQKITPSCEESQEGFCQNAVGIYSLKKLVSSAVEHKPATPDRKEVVSYCTLCNDGTFSPSCAVGRGACSWHGGVAAYNVARYKIIPGTPAIEAKPAVYSYESKSYKASPAYSSPTTPELNEIASYVNRN